ncbi:unnamed protein product [Ambrosiozyma monospora]|uniref:Unnamed protein product n=2 Tax=Ambrosiozyma monospora TaxID=43982 RepID=A0ACB5U9T3_AMBMO|nr:unnamed protein product [Ambrosiozyma monospora]
MAQNRTQTTNPQSLEAYLQVKGPAMATYFENALGKTKKHEELAVKTPKVVTTVEGRSGVRRIKIRNHQVLADAPPAWAGYDLGSSAPELLLGALGACLSHMYIVVAAIQKIPFTSVEVETSGTVDMRKGHPGFEDQVPGITDLEYTIYLGGGGLTPDGFKKLQEDVEKVCPVYNLVKNKNEITPHIVNIDDDGEKKVIF